MPTLEINFGPYAHDAGDAIVPMDVISATGQRVFDDVMALNGSRRVELPGGGRYLVRLHLPNGELLEEQIDVPDDAPNDGPNDTGVREVSMRPALVSPRESFSWAFYLRGGPRSVLASRVPDRPKFLFRFRSERLSPPVVRLFHRRGAALAPAITVAEPLTKVATGEATMFALGASPEPRVLSVTWQADAGPQTRYVLVPPNDPPVESTALVTTRIGLPPDVTIRFTLPEAESLLTFLTFGDLSSVRRVGPRSSERAWRFVDEKFQSPMAAVIGAVYLLRAGDAERLQDWPVRLAKQFPAIPDAAVVAGWHLLRTSDQQRPDEAADFFLAALGAGAPVLAATLRMLNDGLNWLRAADAGGPRIVEASQTARSLVRALVPEPASVTTFHQSVDSSAVLR